MVPVLGLVLWGVVVRPGVVVFAPVLLEGAAPVVLPADAPALAPTAPGAPELAPPFATVRLSTTVRLSENDSAIRLAISLSRELGTAPDNCTAWSVTPMLMADFARSGSFLYADWILLFT